MIRRSLLRLSLRLFARRLGWVGILVTAYEVWRRLPKHRRDQLRELVLRHGSNSIAAVSRYIRPRGA
jgi:hypothetical protein